MRTLIKTIGIFSLLFAFIAFSSCEKDDEIKQEPVQELLYAIPMKGVAPELGVKMPETANLEGIVIGTKAEMEAYIDILLKARDETKGDNPPEPQAISLYGMVGNAYHIWTVDDLPSGYMEGPCRTLYRLSNKFLYEQYQEFVNRTCTSMSVDYLCPYDNVNYTFAIVPNNGCVPSPDWPVVYEGFKLAEYPFNPGDDGPEVVEFIKNMTAF